MKNKQLSAYEAALKALIVALKAKQKYIEAYLPGSFESIKEVNILSAQIEALEKEWEIYLTTPHTTK